jgi:Putative adhesin
MKSTSTGPRLEHPIGRDGLFSLDLRHGTARLRAVDGELIRIRDVGAHDLEELFAIGLGEGSVSLRSVGKHSPASDLEIELPPQTTIVLEAASGEFEVDGLVGDQRYRTASGDVTLRASGGRIAVDAVSGDVDVTATGEASVAIRTVSGDVALRGATLTALQATTTSGDLTIAGRFSGPGPFSIVTVSGDALLAPVGDLRIEMATLSGDLHSEIGGAPGVGRGRRSLSVGTGGQLVNVRSLSGDLNVVRPTQIVDSTPPAPAEAAQPEAATYAAPDLVLPAQGEAPTQTVPDVKSTTPNGALVAAYDDARLRILRSLERGEIDVAEAGRRLETLEGGEPDPTADTTRVSTVEGPDA